MALKSDVNYMLWRLISSANYMFHSQVLDSSPAHVKALYRRGIAYMSAGDFAEARSDFETVASILEKGISSKCLSF